MALGSLGTPDTLLGLVKRLAALLTQIDRRIGDNDRRAYYARRRQRLMVP